MKLLSINSDPAVFDLRSESHSRALANAQKLALRGGRIIILSLGERQLDFEIGNARFICLESSGIKGLFKLARAARALVRQEDVDLVRSVNPFEHGVVALYALGTSSAKLAIQIHVDYLARGFLKTDRLSLASWKRLIFNAIRRRIAARVLPKADDIRVVSKRQRDHLLKHFGESITPPGIFPIVTPLIDAPATALPGRKFGVSLIAVGRLAPEKRIHDIIRAMPILLSHGLDVGLFVVGTGPHRGALDNLVRGLGLKDRVNFLGHRSDVRELMKSADIFVQVSDSEGYGRTLIEAALCRVPIVTTDVGIIGEVIPVSGVQLCRGIGSVPEVAAAVYQTATMNSKNLERVEIAFRSVMDHLISVRTAMDAYYDRLIESSLIMIPRRHRRTCSVTRWV